jgi:hypothetical protein
MARLWKNTDGTREGKYLVLRRDGSVPEWPYLVVGAADPAAPYALVAYAKAAEMFGYDPQFIADIRALAAEFEVWRVEHGSGDPAAPKHRVDHPAVIAAMKTARGS